MQHLVLVTLRGLQPIQNLFLSWLDYSAPHPVCNTGNMKYADGQASLSSGERVLPQGIYVVGSR